MCKLPNFTKNYNFVIYYQKDSAHHTKVSWIKFNPQDDWNVPVSKILATTMLYSNCHRKNTASVMDWQQWKSGTQMPQCWFSQCTTITMCNMRLSAITASSLTTLQDSWRFSKTNSCSVLCVFQQSLSAALAFIVASSFTVDLPRFKHSKAKLAQAG